MSIKSSKELRIHNHDSIWDGLEGTMLQSMSFKTSVCVVLHHILRYSSNVLLIVVARAFRPMNDGLQCPTLLPGLKSMICRRRQPPGSSITKVVYRRQSYGFPSFLRMVAELFLVEVPLAMLVYGMLSLSRSFIPSPILVRGFLHFLICSLFYLAQVNHPLDHSRWVTVKRHRHHKLTSSRPTMTMTKMTSMLLLGRRYQGTETTSRSGKRSPFQLVSTLFTSSAH